jgi:hypothetical protein
MNFLNLNAFGDFNHGEQAHHKRRRANPSNDLALTMKPTNQILVSEPIMPIRQLKEMPLNQAVRDQLVILGISELSEFEWFTWPTIFRGRNLYAMPDGKNSTHLRKSLQPEKSPDWSFSSISYLYPLLSLVIDSHERKLSTGTDPSNGPIAKGYVKKSMCMQAKNGPSLLIICASCSRGMTFMELYAHIFLYNTHVCL